MPLFKEVEPGDIVTTSFDGMKRRGTVTLVEQWFEEPPTCDVRVGINTSGEPLIIEGVPITEVKQTPGSKIRRAIGTVVRAVVEHGGYI